MGWEVVYHHKMAYHLPPHIRQTLVRRVFIRVFSVLTVYLHGLVYPAEKGIDDAQV